MNDISMFSSVREVPGRFSAREFLRMKELGAFEGMRVELVDGEIIRMNPPYFSHGARQASIIVQLSEAYAGVPVVVAGDTGVQVDPDTIRAFDVVVCRDVPADMKLLDPANVILAVEISDTSIIHDLGPKMDDYARASIPEYWVVDLNGRCIHIMSKPAYGQFRDRRLAKWGEEVMPPGGSKPVCVI